MKYKTLLFKNNKLNFTMTIISAFILMICNVYVAVLLMELIDTASTGGMEDLKLLIIKAIIFVIVSVLVGLMDNFFKTRFSRFNIFLCVFGDFTFFSGCDCGKWNFRSLEYIFVIVCIDKLNWDKIRSYIKDETKNELFSQNDSLYQQMIYWKPIRNQIY